MSPKTPGPTLRQPKAVAKPVKRVASQDNKKQANTLKRGGKK